MEMVIPERAQSDVLAQHRLLHAALMNDALAAAKDTPELVKIPTEIVQGEAAGGLTGLAAVLGASIIIRWLERSEARQRDQGRSTVRLRLQPNPAAPGA